ncbi:Gfo/Idh/MocA family protein [Alkalinema pantanalense CENA528]|uniref:Gfo/Idh/MocA family protein n=1 Tax=Alkalinema pantanalense TaxID=1620705 RepID=UPI003D6DFD96
MAAGSGMESSTIGVALVGTGFGQKVHLPALQTHHRTQVVAVYHRDPAKAQAIAQAHQIPHACTTIDEILAIPEVQAVSISTPPFLHYELAKAALTAGKHILLEKPTALNAIEARELYHLATENALAATMNFEFRYIPAWQFFAELIQQGYVGQPRYIKVDWLVSSRADASRPWNWYAQKEQGGGVLGAIGSHAFDYLTWLFGAVRGVSARLSTSIVERTDPATGELKPVTADDTSNITLELLDGTPIQVCLSSVTMQGRGHFLEVYGDRGTLVVGSSNQKDYVHGFQVWGSQSGQPLAELPVPDRLAFPRVFDDGRIAPIVRVVNEWVNSIDQQTAIAPSLREGVYSQLIMDCCHQSNEMHQWVEVPELDPFLNDEI